MPPSETTPRIPVRRVSAPGQVWLELRGSILLFHKQTWVSSSSMYIPVEWIEVSEGRRRDLHYLWQGLLGCLVAFLLALPLSLLFFYMRERYFTDILMMLGLSALFLLMAACGAISLAIFMRTRPFVTLAVQGEYHTIRIHLWNPERGGGPLRELMEKLRAIQKHIRETAPYPVRINHMWHRSHPYRRAFVMGIALSSLLYLVMMIPATLQALGRDVAFSNTSFTWLAAPPLASVAWEALRRGWPWGQPRLYRAAAHACERGDLRTAAAHLNALLETSPDLDPARVLLVRVLTEQGEFETALRHCEYLARQHPSAASALQANIWAIRRIHDRMVQAS